MTVRWKPLLVLSGVFLVIAVAGLAAIAFVLMPSNASDILNKARAEMKAGEFDRAWIQYRRALQTDGQNARIHEEVAAMFAVWETKAPADKRVELRQQRLSALSDAARFDPRFISPRRKLLAEALLQNELGEATRWARELVVLAPDDPDAHFVLAGEALAQSPPNVSQARTHLERLDQAQPDRPRTDWIRAWIAREQGDETTQEKILASARDRDIAQVADPLDRLALLRLLVFDAQRNGEPESISDRVPAIRDVAGAITRETEFASGRIGEVSDLIGQVRAKLQVAAGQAEPETRERLDGLAHSLDEVVETTFRKAIEGPHADLRLYQGYADFLLDRDRYDRCLEIAVLGLKLPASNVPYYRNAAMGLRETAIRAALANTDDPQRFDKAAPFLKEMLGSPSSREQGIGHLFQGAIDLERSGLAGAPSDTPIPPADADKYRTSALDHLKQAASELPQVATAQALYGITLILSREPALGRQYLQAARRLGTLEAKYQLWAAWSMIQAGYPEEAERIVERLRAETESADQPRADLEATLRLLEGEIAQARRQPQDLQKAREDYEKALAAQPDAPLGLELRLVQIDLQLRDHDAALERVNRLRAAGKTSAGVEQLGVVALQSAGRDQEAREALDQARSRYPDSGELASLDAALHLRAEDSQAADRVLAEFLTRHPEHAAATNLRAQILAEQLQRPDEARGLLKAFAERSQTSDPWVQLAQFEMARQNYEGMAQAIAQLRARWKEAAAADLLDAQLALAARRDYRTAAGHLEAALRKDPDNKVALFWKAQIDEFIGAGPRAAKVYEDLVREKPVKELDSGLSLTTAAQWALATQALDNRDIDTAIDRLGELLQNSGNATLTRAVRWKLVDAYTAKGQWPAARAEIIALLKDPSTTTDERVRAANHFRNNQEANNAVTLLDGILKSEPGNPAAVVVRAYMLSEAGKPDEAAALVRRALAASEQPPGVHLMLAAIENVRPPQADASTRALAALDQGLKAHPASLELIQARFRLLRDGDPSAALAYLREQARTTADVGVRRLLAESLREQGDFDEAAQVARELIAAQPKGQPRDPDRTALLVRILLNHAAAAADQGDRDRERALDDQTARLLAEARTEFPTELNFPRAEWELAMRRGDLKRAMAITQEIDRLTPQSTLGPMLRAQLYASQGRTPDVAEAYAEAVGREPRRLDVKLLLAQTQLSLGKPDECLRLASDVIESSRNQPAAILLKARALSALGGTASQVAARRDEALALVQTAIKDQPTFREAYHVQAEIHLRQGRRADALAALEAGLKANPDDATGLSLLVQTLTEVQDKAASPTPTPADLNRAKAIAEAQGGKDTQGAKCLALAIGFQRARQYELAAPWARKAAELIDSPAVHQTHGDILLALAENTTEPEQARAVFRQAVDQYDQVLKVQAGSIEAVNNKAWILHRYLGDNPTALELVEGLLRHTDPSTLPPEFLDTLGAIQQAAGKTREAEESFAQGLRKNPDHPILNFHMGRLLASLPDQRGRAETYLLKARDAGDRLPAGMAAELSETFDRLRR
jgi:predicted Zn-dependent protease